MKWLIIILVVLAAILAVALIATAMKRKKDRVARERAGELRSEAAATATTKQVEEARAREIQAEADRARAEADKLEVQAHEQRTSYDMTLAQQENSLREADRLDPDVDHRSDEYQPGVDGPGRRAATPPQEGHTETHQGTHQAHKSGATPTANPVPPGPETTTPDQAELEAERARRDRDQI